MANNESCSWCGGEKDVFWEEWVIPFEKSMDFKTGKFSKNTTIKKHKTGRFLCFKCVSGYGK